MLHRTGIPGKRLALGVAVCLLLGAAIALLVRSRGRSDVESSSGSQSPVPIAERLGMLEDSFRAIEDGVKQAPRDRWDPQFVVQTIGNDPKLLFNWVRDNTTWIPYRGVLRGA